MSKSTLFFFFFFSCIILSTAVQAQTDSAGFFYQKGLQEKQNGRRLESYKYFEKALHYDEHNKAVLAEMAAACMDLRKYSQAKEMYKKLADLGDAPATTYQQLMNLSFNMRQFDDAILYANQWKKADQSAKVSYIIGKVNYEQENYGEAIRYLTAAAKEEPANGEIPYLIARSYSDMSNYKQAIPFFQQAVALDTTKSNWLYELGLICYASHDDKNALKYILLAGEKGYKRDNDYLENLGIAYLNAGRFDEGLAIMNELLKKRPSDLNILDMVAEACYYKGKYDQAMGYWDTILGYDKTNAAALYMIGMCYQKKGDKDKGVQLCDKAIEMDPSLASYKQKKMNMGL
ncbi:MAG TPA: tetratricopeptide repeat protein [Chitinophagaceae bacterium]|nr:tetratricopeptide repeat protein [Chitinophagaceae bacterium]